MSNTKAFEDAADIEAKTQITAGVFRPAMHWLTEEELSAVADLAREADLPYEQVMRQSLRLYQLVRHAAKLGYQMNLTNMHGEEFLPRCGCGVAE